MRTESLFHPHARARNADPDTSHIAAAKVDSSGDGEAQRLACLHAVSRYPGYTAAEIARAIGLERHIPSRRLPELRDGGYVVNGEKRKCRETGNLSMTWWMWE